MEDEYIDELFAGGDAVTPPEPVHDDEDVKEQLHILVTSGKSKEMVGRVLSQGDVDKMNAPEARKLYRRYETVIASPTTDALADLLYLTSKIVGMALPIDDIEALHVDLLSDYIINQAMQSLYGTLSLRSGWLPARGEARW